MGNKNGSKIRQENSSSDNSHSENSSLNFTSSCEGGGDCYGDNNFEDMSDDEDEEAQPQTFTEFLEQTF